MTRDRHKLWRAALIAPISAPLAISAVFVWELVTNSQVSQPQDVFVAVGFVFAFGLPISYAAMLLLGMPYIIWLRSINRLRGILVCAGSLTIGAAVWTAYLQLSVPPSSVLETAPVGAIIGLLVGIIFCQVARCGPNDSSKPTAAPEVE
jgi:hypothetical protein